MAIQENTIPLTDVSGGLKQDKSPLVIESRYTPLCENVLFHDGVVKKRTGLVWDVNAFVDLSSSDPDPATDTFGPLVHYENYTTNATKKFLLPALVQNSNSDLELALYSYATTWGTEGVTALGASGFSTGVDYWITYCSIVDDTDAPKDGTPDDEYLVLNVTPLDPSAQANIDGLYTWNQDGGGLAKYATTEPEDWAEDSSYYFGGTVKDSDSKYYKCIKDHVSESSSIDIVWHRTDCIIVFDSDGDRIYRINDELETTSNLSTVNGIPDRLHDISGTFFDTSMESYNAVMHVTFDTNEGVPGYYRYSLVGDSGALDLDFHINDFCTADQTDGDAVCVQYALRGDSFVDFNGYTDDTLEIVSGSGGGIATGTYSYDDFYVAEDGAYLQYNTSGVLVTEAAPDCSNADVDIKVYRTNDGNQPCEDTNKNYWFEFTPRTNFKCSRVLAFNGHLVCLGMDQAHKIVWFPQWNHTEADGAGSGWFYTYDDDGPIMNGELLNESTIIAYKASSIWSGTRVTTDSYIRWRQAYPDIGLLAPQLLARWGNYHIFVGNNNVYMYGGGGELYPIGTPIWTSLIGDIRKDDPKYKRRCFISIHRDKGDINIWIVTSGSQYPDKAYTYNIYTRAWSVITLPNAASKYLELLSWGEYEADADVYDAEYVPFYIGAQQTSNAMSLLKVLKWDYATYTDPLATAADATSTASISAYWYSKDSVSSLEGETQTSRIFSELSGSGSVTVGIEFNPTDGAVETTEHTIASDYAVYATKVNRKGYKSRIKVYSDNTGNWDLRALEFKQDPVAK